MSAPLLEVDDLHAYYGKSHILHGVTFNVHEGEIVSLLGRNGVGRSTTIKAIMGNVPPKGSIRFKGEEIAGCRPHQTARKGLGVSLLGRNGVGRSTTIKAIMATCHPEAQSASKARRSRASNRIRRRARGSASCPRRATSFPR